jgi:hypothetical protein
MTLQARPVTHGASGAARASLLLVLRYSRSLMALELPSHHRGTGLVDVLDRVLDKGLVIAGDIRVSLAEVEL